MKYEKLLLKVKKLCPNENLFNNILVHKYGHIVNDEKEGTFWEWNKELENATYEELTYLAIIIMEDELNFLKTICARDNNLHLSECRKGCKGCKYIRKISNLYNTHDVKEYCIFNKTCKNIAKDYKKR